LLAGVILIGLGLALLDSQMPPKADRLGLACPLGPLSKRLLRLALR
jgi:hypothetical protein